MVDQTMEQIMEAHLIQEVKVDSFESSETRIIGEVQLRQYITPDDLFELEATLKAWEGKVRQRRKERLSILTGRSCPLGGPCSGDDCRDACADLEKVMKLL